MAKHTHRPGSGRHRLGGPGLVHCRAHGSVGDRMAGRRPSLRGLFRDRSRHTVSALTRHGGRPRLAFVLIASM
ncbi:MAG: hypothetical protein HY241_16720 [Actinobacteria bacterium]|nr:hypothetical protein [Actinomycetota bacterium]